METLGAAADAACDCLVLCDTNGGCLPWEIHDITATVVAAYPGLRVGIHCHNDLELACANSLSAVNAGASLVQGCQNGLGERTGNASLTSIIPSLQLKMNMLCVGDALVELTSLSRYIDEISNQAPVASRPFTGTSAFARAFHFARQPCCRSPSSFMLLHVANPWLCSRLCFFFHLQTKEVCMSMQS
jgi:2-isopropylmalate synthase